MFAQEVDKGTNTCTDGSVAIINRAKRHLYRQTFICHQLHKLSAGDLFINHVIRQAGDTISGKAQLF